jgi:predicted nuclease of restriction endonuclease-like (RecB) superfamily
MKPSHLTRHEAAFRPVVHLIQTTRHRTVHALNQTLIELYWKLGGYIDQRIASAGWGKSTVLDLARFIARHDSSSTGFSAQNLWRMRQFYRAYHTKPKLSAVLRELNWTSNLLILGKCRSAAEREFYLQAASRERWSSRELERQLDNGLFARSILHPPKLSAVLRELHPKAAAEFKDTYALNFLELPDRHSEAALQRGIIEKLRGFLSELGRDFCFVGEQYPLQVGRKNYHLDLLFYHRGLQCLVAIELKVEEFKPEHIGKLQFYLEALDRDVRKPHERPSIGVLLCATKDNKVVEYSLSRSTAATLVAEYSPRLPSRQLWRRKLQEFYASQRRSRPPSLPGPSQNSQQC